MISSQFDLNAPLPSLDAIEAELQRRRWERDPIVWAQERLNDFLWSGQKKILASIRDNRRTAVKSCHEIGKSFIAGDVVAWWVDSSPPGDAFVVTSAPSGPQVKTILWREIGRVHTRGRLAGRINQVEWILRMPDQDGMPGKEEQVAIGRKPDEYEPTAFQGIHARKVLYVFDEACGMPASLWEAADSLIANNFSKALAIGNPDDPNSEFAKICQPGSGWNVVEIGAFDTPNFTGEYVPERLSPLLIGHIYVEEKRRKWAPQWYWVDKDEQPVESYEQGAKCVPPEGIDPQATNPLWQSKVLGKFPKLGDAGGLIPHDWVTRAQQREYFDSEDSVELGVDVGGGGDSSCIAKRRGRNVRIILEDRNPDTMATCGNVIASIEHERAVKTRVDIIGIGRGVVDRAQEQKYNVVGVNVSEKPIQTRDYTQEEAEKMFFNLRAQVYWHVRTQFENDALDLDPTDDDLAGQLVELRFKRNSRGQIVIESKDDMKRRKVPSPNRAEALMLSMVPEKIKTENVLEGRAVW